MITDHSRHAVPVVVDGISYMQDYLYAGLLDGSWFNMEQYEEEMFNMASDDDTFMSLLCVVYTVLEEYKEIYGKATVDDSLTSLLLIVTLVEVPWRMQANISLGFYRFMTLMVLLW